MRPPDPTEWLTPHALKTLAYAPKIRLIGGAQFDRVEAGL